MKQQERQAFDESQFGQINLNIPYRKIARVKFEVVSQKKVDNQIVYEIEPEYKFQGLTKMEKPMKIHRTLADFQWLVSSLKQGSNRFIVIPRLETLQKWTDKIPHWNFTSSKPAVESSKQTACQQVKDHKSRFQLVMIQRFLKIISQITFQYMYQKPGQFQNPLFIFIQPNDLYNFYRTMQDQQKKREQSVINSYWSGFVDYSKNMVSSYIPNLVKRKDDQASSLQHMRQIIYFLYNKGIKLNQRLQSLRNSLGTLSRNFIKKRKEIQQKTKQIQIFLHRLDENIKYTHLIMKQLQENIQNYKKITQKNQKEVQNYISQEIQKYLQFIQKQQKNISSNISKIGTQFIEVNARQDQRVKISIGDLYHNFQATKPQKQ